MTPLDRIAPEFVRMAHGIVWASVATVAPDGRPRSRILHPIWEWDGIQLVGWIATVPTPLKEAHLAAHPDVSVSYWTPTHDTCTAECTAEWVRDDEGRTRVWQLFEHGPAPVGYDPTIIEDWRDGPTSPAFAAWRLTPYRLRVMPSTVMTHGERELLLTWER